MLLQGAQVRQFSLFGFSPGFGALLLIALFAVSCQSSNDQPVIRGENGLVTKDNSGFPFLPAANKQRPRGSIGLQSEPPLQGVTYQEGTGSTIGAGRARYGRSSGGDVTLNLAAVPVPLAAKSVLGDILGLNYSVDPRLNAPVTIQTSKPVSRDEAIRLFEAALL